MRPGLNASGGIVVMIAQTQLTRPIVRSYPQAARIIFLLVIFAAVTAACTVQAQTFTVLHSFTGGPDGQWSASGITLGGSGTLYGTSFAGGTIQQNCTAGCGTVFKLTLHNGNWIFSPLYQFPSSGNPRGGITMGPGGIPFGTTSGINGADGTVFYVTPGLNICQSVQCYWNETNVYTFTGSYGVLPQYSNLSFDSAGNIYGTTFDGPYPGGGAMYELMRSGESWTPILLHSFGTGNDGTRPYSNVVIDHAGNYYATTTMGGTAGLGTVIQVVPGQGFYTDNIIYNFSNDQNGNTPSTGLVMDGSGNLYGTTAYGGSGGGGTVFELTPSGGQWQFSLLYSFTGSSGPVSGNLTMDANGNLYGTTGYDGLYDEGMAFKLSQSNGSWTLTDLHDFTGGADGGDPSVNVALDSDGNLFGTTSGGGSTAGTCGAGGCGVVWKIAP